MRWTAGRPFAGLLGTAMVAVLAAGAALALPGPAHAETNGGVRIMPLGDSITDGFNVPGGYRVGLWQDLVTTGYSIDFVGSEFNGPGELGDHDHQGHSGWRIDQLAANVVPWLEATKPRTVLLHIGTNDLTQNHDVANAPARLSALIDRIVSAAPDVELFVAMVTPMWDVTLQARARAFNAAIPGIVRQKVTAGHHVHLVDMHSALAAADLADGVHPTAGGYAKMATVWYNALRSVPASLAEVVASSTAQLVNARDGRCLDVDGALTAPGTPTLLLACHTGSSQRWTRTAAGEFRVYDNSCLDVYGGAAAGKPVIIDTCNGSVNQRWRSRADGTVLGVNSNLCLAPVGGGTSMQLAICSTDASQRWTTE
ncbi:MAG TPA: ricin-type beta-trefoil lectin domain protein [Micromonosporaceae bacterium]|nr:ricin-type beta-trefoil lectin domain protein [Micromonosporaceae bacterium]